MSAVPIPGHSCLARTVASTALVALTACSAGPTPAPDPASTPGTAPPARLTPVVVTDPTPVDSDDPAIWIDPADPSASLILGTDKGGHVVVFDLDGRMLHDRTFSAMKRANNIDVEVGLTLAGEPTDIAAVTDRDAGLLRVFKLPEMTPVDGGGIEVFAGEAPERRRPMGVALYRRPADGAVFVFVSRKEGPDGAYLWQYRLDDNGTGTVRATKVRELGAFGGVARIEDGEVSTSEIEAIAVDDALGYVYYADEWTGIRKYHADPGHPGADVELALFGTDGFADDREGISIYPVDERTGYILVSDQQANAFRVFTREGSPNDPHDHRFIASIPLSTNESDGSEVTAVPVDPRFPNGLFVAMSDDRSFHYYSWDDMAGEVLARAARAAPPR